MHWCAVDRLRGEIHSCAHQLMQYRATLAETPVASASGSPKHKPGTRRRSATDHKIPGAEPDAQCDEGNAATDHDSSVAERIANGSSCLAISATLSATRVIDRQILPLLFHGKKFICLGHQQ